MYVNQFQSLAFRFHSSRLFNIGAIHYLETASANLDLHKTFEDGYASSLFSTRILGRPNSDSPFWTKLECTKGHESLIPLLVPY